MGYFSADEKLERGGIVPPAPYNLRLTEVDDARLTVGLAWQRPLGTVEGYLVLFRSSEFRVPSSELGQDAGEWRTVLKITGREKSGAQVRLGPEVWQHQAVELAVVAYCGKQISLLSNRVTLPPRLRLPAVITVLPPASSGQSDPEITRTEAPNPETANRSETQENQRSETANREEPELAGWAEIEAALRQNSAALGRHGLFVRRNE
jgi:hypothetical protein